MVSFVRAPRVLQAPPEVPLDSSQRATVHMAASLLLDYPAEGTLQTRLNAVEAELAGLPPEVAVLLEEFIADELPDYLPVVLELSARSGDEVAGALLSSHREGIEVLRSALADAASPYAGLVEAVSMTLPRIDEATAERVRALVAAGPPTETVGVTDTLPFPTVPVRNPSLSGSPTLPDPVPVAGPSPSRAARRA